MKPTYHHHLMTCLSACFLLMATQPATVCAEQDNATLQAYKQQASTAVQDEDYKNLITQHSSDSKAPNPKLFTEWILDEINNDSLMRDQIADELDKLQKNGHNSNRVTLYYTRDKKYLGRLWFKANDITIECTGGGKDGIYDYQAELRAEDGFHGGYTIISFKYKFKVKNEYFKYTKAYMVNVIRYPRYEGKTKKEVDQ